MAGSPVETIASKTCLTRRSIADEATLQTKRIGTRGLWATVLWITTDKVKTRTLSSECCTVQTVACEIDVSTVLEGRFTISHRDEIVAAKIKNSK